MRKWGISVGIAAAVAVCSLSGVAEAGSVIDAGRYRLCNHPDGGAAKPYYGLRLDGLIGNDADDYFTFDFERKDKGAAMHMEYKTDARGGPSSIHIYGTAWGGQVDNRSSTTGYTAHERLYTIDFTYDVGLRMLPGDDDIQARPYRTDVVDYQNSGSISWVDEKGNKQSTKLWDYSGHHDYTFQLGDHPDDKGHRGFDGVSGWGWIAREDRAGDKKYYKSSDWLFTVKPVPLPPAALIGGLLLGGLGVMRRRREKDA